MKSPALKIKSTKPRGRFYGFAALLTAAVLSASSVAYAAHHMKNEEQSKADYREVKKETAELLKTLKSYAATQREKALSATRSALDDLDTRIDALESQTYDQWADMAHPVRVEARKNLRALREQRNEVGEWYGSLKSSSDAAWADVKSGFSDAYQELYDAWKKATKEYQDNDGQS